MTTRIFRCIFLVALMVLASSLIFVMWVVHSRFMQTELAQLKVEASLASQAVSNEGLPYLESLDDTIDCRITWISSDGTVLYDNRSDTVEMENHLQREEVRQALETGYGQSTRYSGTLMARYIYVAKLLPDGSILRLSASKGSVLGLMLGMWDSIVLVIIAVLALSYWLSLRLSREVVKPLNELNLEMPLANEGYEEIQPLLRQLESQQRQLRAQSTELKQKQKEFNTVTRSLSEGLVLLNSSGTILSINPSAAKLL